MKSTLIALLTLFSSYAWCTELSVRDAYVPLMPPASKTYAAYMSIVNASERNRTITKVSADGFGMTHLHNSVEKDGVASMELLHMLEIPAGETVILSPGARHIMLMMRSKKVSKGDMIKITLSFSDGEVVTVEAVVREFN